MEQIKYDVNKLKDFDTEWLLHKKCSEWWYSTSILRDEENNLYSCQYTFLRMRLLPFLKPYILMSAITDFKTKKHYYTQSFTLSKNEIEIDKTKVVCKDASIIKNSNNMLLQSKGNNFFYFF